MSGNKVKGSAVVAVAVAAALLATGCVAEDTAEVSVQQVVGTWTSPDGEVLKLRSDRSFVASGLDSEKLYLDDCPASEANGSWGFNVADGSDDAYMSGAAESGDSISFIVPGREWCYGDLAIVDGGDTLCFTDEMPCDYEVRHRRKD